MEMMSAVTEVGAQDSVDLRAPLLQRITSASPSGSVGM